MTKKRMTKRIVRRKQGERKRTDGDEDVLADFSSELFCPCLSNNVDELRHIRVGITRNNVLGRKNHSLSLFRRHDESVNKRWRR